MDNLIDFTVRFPIAQSLGNLVKQATEKLQKGEELTDMEKLVVASAIQGLVKSF